MAKFRFSGDPATDVNGEKIDKGTESIVFRDLEFHRKTDTDVSDKAVIAKLRGNSHFEEQANKPKPKAKAKDEG